VTAHDDEAIGRCRAGYRGRRCANPLRNLLATLFALTALTALTALAWPLRATADTVRFAAFNASLNRNSPGQLLADLALPKAVDITRRDRLLKDERDSVVEAHSKAELRRPLDA